jgi:hypothetical protein
MLKNRGRFKNYVIFLLWTTVKFVGCTAVALRISDLWKCVHVFFFFNERQNPTESYFKQDLWIAKLGHLDNIFEKLNALSVSLPWKDNNEMHLASEKIKA